MVSLPRGGKNSEEMCGLGANSAFNPGGDLTRKLRFRGGAANCMSRSYLRRLVAESFTGQVYVTSYQLTDYNSQMPASAASSGEVNT